MSKAENEVITQTITTAEFHRRLLNFEPAIHEAEALAEILSEVAEREGAIEYNSLLFLIYQLDERVKALKLCWKGALAI